MYRPPPSQSFDLSDLDEQHREDETERLLLEAHEMASWSYDMLQAILEVNVRIPRHV